MKLTSLMFIAAAMLVISACSKVAENTVASNEAARPAAAPAATRTPRADPGDAAPRISLEEAKKDFDNKTAVFVDTHPADQFALEHIPGAINIQANTIKQNLDKVPKGKKIIAYCS